MKYIEQIRTFRAMHILRLWDPASLKIRRKIFIRSRVLVGSDISAHFRVTELDGLFAQIDFEAGELTYLADGRVEKLESEQIYSIGNLVLQYRRVEIAHQKWIAASATFLLGIALVGFGHSMYRRDGVQPLCSRFSALVNQGRWNPLHIESENQKKIMVELNIYKKSFDQALSKKNLVVAQAELAALSETLSKIPVEEGCSTHQKLDQLEMRLSQLKIQDDLHEKRFVEAAEEWGRLAAKVQGRKIDRLRERIQKSARVLYLEGYQIEDTRPDEGDELMERAERVCVALQLEAECYRSEIKKKTRGSARHSVEATKVVEFEGGEPVGKEVERLNNGVGDGVDDEKYQ